MLHRRTAVLAFGATALAAPRIGRAADTTGITAAEIRIGNTAPYSGPASAYGTIARAEAAYFRMLNEQGGIAGRRIAFISYDDGYSPPKTVEQVRRLVEQDKVACLFQNIGTACNSAIVRYANQRKVPHLFIGSGADKWGSYQDTPWTIGWQPSYRIEAQIYTHHMLRELPRARMALLYQNDDFGKDYLLGVRDVLKDRFDAVVTTASFEVTDPTIDSQVLSLQRSGAEVLLTAATPKFAAQAIRKVFDIGWRPALHALTNVSISAGTVMLPAGAEKGVGIVTSAYLKDPTDPGWKDDPGMRAWRDFMQRYYPEGDLADAGNVFGYGIAATMAQAIRQCGKDLSRERLMREAANLKALDVPVLLPGVRVDTSPTNYHPIRQMQLARWTGSTWERFGEVIEGAPAS
ncbi:ABC transporter substrate-binding protein [Roseicella aquatilis]|uniref:Branched-chain amino acid ABC transporter substrate-binding protein n=1 Tax=Roseicella aquatilis TaxID=2527868 RepID=A0A4R4D838_9PROT|nr:ABC transporter substrate-binding protein [Roseicella aquatilis]TCZ56626.1 branched-chain amino acid ABC transporter substrate-binding protein [Roseicella aquatilis]